jgi:hypothetical protein
VENQLAISARASRGCGGVERCGGDGGGGAGKGVSAVFSGGGSTVSSAAQADIERATTVDSAIEAQVRSPHMPLTVEHMSHAGNLSAFRV